MTDLTVLQFKGLRTDKGQKFVESSNLFDIQNFNYDSIIGLQRVMMPSIIYNNATSNSVDGIFEFSYLSEENLLVRETIAVIGGSIYKNWLSGSPEVIATNLTPGKCSFAVFNDKLIITNGKDYPKMYDGVAVYDMGAPRAQINFTEGVLVGEYQYAMTFVTENTNEEYLGTVSNVVNLNFDKVNLYVPLGYEGTTSRKLYRTKAGGSVFFFLAEIDDNTTFAYVDNTVDALLGESIPAVNNECPKPYFIQVANERMVGAVSDQYLTQAWVSTLECEVFDLAVFRDVANIGNDNTRIVGMELDYSKIIIGTEKQIYILDTEDQAFPITQTRANVGVLNGYGMARIPQSGDFPGGVMFVSSLGDIRLFNGNFAGPVPTSLDNLKTENFSQEIRPTLQNSIAAATTFSAHFFDYKYHLSTGQKIFVFDIRTKAWTQYVIKTDSYTDLVNCFGVVSNKFYAGQQGAGIIEKFYNQPDYRGESCVAYFETPHLLASDQFKFIEALEIFFDTNGAYDVDVVVTYDGDPRSSKTYSFRTTGGVYDFRYFSQDFFEASINQEDYRVIYLNQRARWFSFKLINNSGAFNLKGYTVKYRNLPENPL